MSGPSPWLFWFWSKRLKKATHAIRLSQLVVLLIQRIGIPFKSNILCVGLADSRCFYHINTHSKMSNVRVLLIPPPPLFWTFFFSAIFVGWQLVVTTFGVDLLWICFAKNLHSALICCICMYLLALHLCPPCAKHFCFLLFDHLNCWGGVSFPRTGRDCFSGCWVMGPARWFQFSYL